MVYRSESELEQFGRTWGKKAHRKGQRLFALVGPLGAGKTTFVRGFAAGLGITERITSPTFILARRYRIPKSAAEAEGKRRPSWFWHIDLYRVSGKEAADAVDLRSLCADKDAVVAVEWAEKVKEMLPSETIWIRFEHHQEGRKVEIKQSGAR